MEFTYILYMGEAIALTVMLGVIAIPLARKYKAQQSIREEGPKSHRLKAGTPTMGGLFVCLSVVLVVIWNRLADPSVLWLLFLTLGHGLLGFLDDLIKAEKKRNLTIDFSGLFLLGMCRDASSAIFNLNSILINGDRDWSAVLYFCSIGCCRGFQCSESD